MASVTVVTSSSVPSAPLAPACTCLLCARLLEPGRLSPQLMTASLCRHQEAACPPQQQKNNTKYCTSPRRHQSRKRNRARREVKVRCMSTTELTQRPAQFSGNQRRRRGRQPYLQAASIHSVKTNFLYGAFGCTCGAEQHRSSCSGYTTSSTAPHHQGGREFH